MGGDHYFRCIVAIDALMQSLHDLGEQYLVIGCFSDNAYFGEDHTQDCALAYTIRSNRFPDWRRAPRT